MIQRQSSGIVMTFGTFDRFHLGHEYYLREAKKLGNRLITVIARDETVMKIKQKKSIENENTRLQKVTMSNIADEVILGSLDDPYYVIRTKTPDILCFGYDQQSFNDERLENYLDQYNLHPKIFILPAFEPDKWKSSKLDSRW